MEKMKISNWQWLPAITLPILLLISSYSIAVPVSLNSVAEGGDSAFSGELKDSSCSDTGVIMFHGRGSSPTGPVVHELSNSLNRAGYRTLSIENPLPLNQQVDFSSYVNDVNTVNYVFPESYARMRTAINYLESLGAKKIVVAGFSLGSRLLTGHVARGQTNELPIIGLIGVGMYANSIDPLNTSLTLDEVSVPVLDVYGDADTNSANTATSRQAAYYTGSGLSYTQNVITCISGANCHQLEGNKGDDSQELEIAVNAWMQSFAPVSVMQSCNEVVTENISNASGSIGLIFLGILVILAAIKFSKKEK